MKAERDFWSRRRAGVQAEAEAEARAQAVLPPEDDTRSDTEILAELNLPDPDTLISGDDVAAFMARAVPEHLRRRALRRLWRLNPVLANLDGLNDYDGDFTTGSVPTGMLQTSYQVGKGLRAHIEALAAQAEETPEPEEPIGEEPPVIAETKAEPAAASETVAEPDIEESEEHAPRPRRMVFTFTQPQEAQA
ncbi:MAG: hypothetical protein CML02_19220 [Pseudooceanicola sp.]|jgi:hypothetical protein|nr:hypothetical protein [Pseudooceanicola sp.]